MLPERCPDVAGFAVRISRNTQSNEYQINSFAINKDTKNWKFIHLDYFNKYGILIDSKNNSTWENYDNPSWKPIIDEILKRAN